MAFLKEERLRSQHRPKPSALITDEHLLRGKITASDEAILKTELPSDAVRLYASKNHPQNWLDCIASRKLPVADVEIGHRTATACHLANMAVRVGRKIQWDPVAEQIIGDAEAAALASRPYRGPWKLA